MCTGFWYTKKDMEDLMADGKNIIKINLKESEILY